MSVVEAHGKSGAPLKSLRIGKVGGVGILRENGHGAEHAGGFGIVLVELQRAGDQRIEAGDGRADAERRTDQAVGAGADAAGGDGGAAGAGADRSAQAADAAAGRVLHDAGVDAENVGARLGAQQIGVGDVQVVAGDVDIEIVLERERDRVIDREIDLAVAHQGIDARRVARFGCASSCGL